MTSAEEFTKAFEYLDALPCWQWHDFKVVPEEIANRMFTLIDSNTFSKEYRLAWCEMTLFKEEFLFIKTEVANINLKI
jgi:hypothetical protein